MTLDSRLARGSSRAHSSTTDGQVTTDRSLIAHSLSAILEFTKQNKLNKNRMKVLKLETYKTTFGRVYQPLCFGLN
jgi:hypothetical protein